jgi:hypothetical protein
VHARCVEAGSDESEVAPGRHDAVPFFVVFRRPPPQPPSALALSPSTSSSFFSLAPRPPTTHTRSTTWRPPT